MRSGNGRHRRPRQAPALIVTAGVTGAGLALPLLGATGANAADGTTWDRIADCESGGLWSAGANGYYGGLQLTQDTWERYGGTRYAERPDLASRGAQIAVGEKILADQGPEAWAGCVDGTGLADGATAGPEADDGRGSNDRDPGDSGSGAADEDEETGTAGRSSAGPDAGAGDEERAPASGRDGGTERDESGSDDSASSPERSGDEAADPSDRSDDDKPGDTSRPQDPAGPEDFAEDEDAQERGAGTGRHRGAPDPAERDGAEHSSRGGERHRGGPDGTARDGDAYQVRTGDSLSAIADEHEVRGGWPSLYEQNREVVGDDPDLIHPGQELTL